MKMNKKCRRGIRKEVKDFLIMFFIVASFPLCFMSVYMTLKGLATAARKHDKTEY